MRNEQSLPRPTDTRSSTRRTVPASGPEITRSLGFMAYERALLPSFPILINNVAARSVTMAVTERIYALPLGRYACLLAFFLQLHKNVEADLRMLTDRYSVNS